MLVTLPPWLDRVSSRGLVVVAALLGAGCGSHAWTLETRRSPATVAPVLVPAHRAVERVTLRTGGRESAFVSYRTCDPERAAVRAEWLLDTGITVLDVAMREGAPDRLVSRAFEAIPGLERLAAEDLRRVWGVRSVFGRSRSADLPADAAGAAQPLAGALLVSDGTTTWPADRLPDGSYVAYTARPDDATAGSFRVTLLDPALVPEARIAYADFDDGGVPREIHLVDLRDGHTLGVEVEESGPGRAASE